MAARRPGLVWHAVPMPGRLDWTREEIILAMDFYVRVGGLDGASIPYHDSEAIGSLSALLIRLGAYPPQLRGQKYRNPNGIYLKLMNLRAVQAEGAHGMPAYSQLDAAVWRDYVDDLPRLHAEAQAIRARLDDSIIQPASTVAMSEDVDIEQQHTEKYTVTPSGQPRAAERAEQRLVMRYRDYMASKSVSVRRRRYRPAGEVRPIYSDIWVEARHALIEAKNSDGRDAVRQAIGQLFDYRRFHEAPIHQIHHLVALLFFVPGWAKHTWRPEWPASRSHQLRRSMAHIASATEARATVSPGVSSTQEAQSPCLTDTRQTLQLATRNDLPET